MATAATLVKQILSEIVTRGSEAPIEPDEAQDTLFGMNTYMAAQAANGINLGYTQVTNLGEKITVPDGALMGMIANIAIMMAPTFDAEISASLVAKAKIGLQAMRKLGVSIGPMSFPDTLPRGSGNEGNNTFDNDRFYHNDEPSILTEGGGSIGLETNTNGT